MIRILLSGALAASSMALAGPAVSADNEVVEVVRENAERFERRDTRRYGQRGEQSYERGFLRPAAGPRLFEGRAAATSPLSSGGRGDLRSLVSRHAAANGVPPELAHGVVMVESRYNPRATGRGGYIGLMQIGYRTARSMGYSGSRSGLYDPDTNLRYGMKYLGMAYHQSGGSMCGAVSRYQGGHGARGITRAGSAYCGKMKKYIASSRRGTQTASR